jgi:hypothetical protein
LGFSAAAFLPLASGVSAALPASDPLLRLPSAGSALAAAPFLAAAPSVDAYIH